MKEAIEIRRQLDARALELHLKDNPAQDWVKQFQATPLADEQTDFKMDEAISSSKAAVTGQRPAIEEDDDVIEMKLTMYVHCLPIILVCEAIIEFEQGIEITLFVRFDTF
jgi:hypothetical protein